MSHKYKVGDIVMHAHYGKVKIIALDGFTSYGMPAYMAETLENGMPAYKAETLENGMPRLPIGTTVNVLEGPHFLTHLIKAAPKHKFKVGQRIVDMVYGAGVVEGYDGRDYKVRYDGQKSGGKYGDGLYWTTETSLKAEEPARKFKIGAKVSTTYGDGTVEAYGDGPYYKVRVPKPKSDYFRGVYEPDLFVINERDMTEIVEKYVPQAGDFVTWGSGVSGFAFIGVAGDKAYLATPGADLMTGKPVLKDRVAHTTDAGYFLETVRKVEKPKVKRTIEVEIGLMKEGGKFIAYAASDEDPVGGFGDPTPNRVATQRIKFEVEA